MVLTQGAGMMGRLRRFLEKPIAPLTPDSGTTSQSVASQGGVPAWLRHTAKSPSESKPNGDIIYLIGGKHELRAVHKKTF